MSEGRVSWVGKVRVMVMKRMSASAVMSVMVRVRASVGVEVMG